MMPGCEVSVGVILGILRTDDENTDFFPMFTNQVCTAISWRGEWKKLHDRFKKDMLTLPAVASQGAPSGQKTVVRTVVCDTTSSVTDSQLRPRISCEA